MRLQTANRVDSYETDTVQQAIKASSDDLGRYISERHAKLLTGFAPMSFSESPIEAVFWVWWQNVAEKFRVRFETCPPFELIQQFTVQVAEVRYRLDFAVLKHRLAIELDGHNFHERTPEQVIRRDERDRRLQSVGWSVLHYSGTELLRDPPSVVQDVFGRCLKAERIEA